MKTVFLEVLDSVYATVYSDSRVDAVQEIIYIARLKAYNSMLNLPRLAKN